MQALTERTLAPLLARRAAWLLCGLWLLAGVVGHDPWKADDALHLGVAWSMAGGDWLVPRIAGDPWLVGPPLYHWLAALCGKLFGWLLPWHDAARLASALFGGLYLVVISRTAYRLDGGSAALAAPLLAVQFVKRPALRCRQVASSAPARRDRQHFDVLAASGEPVQIADGDAGAQRIKRRARRQPGPKSQAEAFAARAQAGARLPLAQLAQQSRQRNPDRADDAALLAKCRGLRQVERFVNAAEERRQDRTHRPRVDPAVGVPADSWSPLRYAGWPQQV